MGAGSASIQYTLKNISKNHRYFYIASNDATTDGEINMHFWKNHPQKLDEFKKEFLDEKKNKRMKH
jgi:hypothetical protein